MDLTFSLNGLSSIAESFDADAVQKIIRQVQRQEIDYPTFLKETMKAGTSGYIAYLKGRRVVYLGRMGDMHTEHFPPATD